MIKNTNESLLNEIDETLDEWENRFGYDGNSTILTNCTPNEKLSENIIETTPEIRVKSFLTLREEERMKLTFY